MSRKIIIFGAGHDGREAVDFFGVENVFCFVDNNTDLHGKTLKGLNILSFNQLVELYEQAPLFAENAFEIIVAMSFDRWAVHSVASKLKKSNIDDFSIFSDVKRRWKSGKKFLRRDREVYPCEQEYLHKIYLAQNDWLLRHTDPAKLLPAVGELRRFQIKNTESAFNVLNEVESSLGVKPFLYGCSLLGAVRHRGFTPWDDDIDFCLPRAEFNELYDYFLSRCGVYYWGEHDNWVKMNGKEFPKDTDSKYIVFCYFDVISIKEIDRFMSNKIDIMGNMKAQELCSIPGGIDIIPLDYFPASYTNDSYKSDFIKWNNNVKRLKDHDIINMWKKTCGDTPLSGNYRLGISMAFSSLMDRIYGKYGKSVGTCIWDYDDIYDLQKMPFESKQFWVPRNIEAILTSMYGKDHMQLPERYGVCCHNKDAVFSETY